MAYELGGSHVSFRSVYRRGSELAIIGFLSTYRSYPLAEAVLKAAALVH